MSWTDVADAQTVLDAGMTEVEAAGAAILLCAVAGAIHATAAICPHHAAWLSQGRIDGEYLDCPRHQGRFHIPTGHQVRGPECPPLQTYPTRIEANRVLVQIEAVETHQNRQ